MDDYDQLILSYDRNMYTKDPYNFGASRFFRDLFGYDDSDWVEPIKQTLEYYDTLLIKKNGNVFLPKGTLLYHGSLNYPFREGSQSTNDPNKITFFALDATISIWYVLELIEMLAIRDLRNVNIDDFFNRYGYLYLFELTEDLPVHKILKNLSQNPKEQRTCVRRNQVCLHPQVNFRGLDRPDLYELSSEVTFYYSDFKDGLQLVDTYLVDPLLLFQNKNNPDYDPRQSVVKINTYQPEFDQKISKKKYIEYYLSKLNGGEKRELDETTSNVNDNIKRTKRTSTSPLYRELLKNGIHIVKIVNSLNMFQPGTEIIFRIEKQDGGIYCTFHLSTNSQYKNIQTENITDNYSIAVYMIETDGLNKGYRSGAGRGVKSSGFRIGHFLFYLQLLLCIKTGIIDFQLENFTDEPSRAARPDGGIYGMLEPDRRTHEQELRDSLEKLNLEDTLQITEGSMRLKLASNSLEIWKIYFNNLIEKINNNIGGPWIRPINKNIINSIMVGGKSKIHKKYTKGLSKSDKKQQLKNIRTAKKAYKNKKYIDRPKLKSYKNKKSSWAEKFKQKYGDITKIKDISKATGIPEGALNAVLKKGRGAYYSSGSRPNQTAESWGRARMYSYIMGGPTRKYDQEITKKYNVKFSQVGGEKAYKVIIKPSTNSEKKKMAIFYDKNNNKMKTTHFGAAGMSDYTKHKDPERKQRYLNRHKKNENWEDFMSAGSLSRYILWGEPTLSASIKKYKERFNLK